jgi:arylsulfatase
MSRITATKAWLLPLAVCLGLLGCRSGVDTAGYPNIVLVTLDTTRADHLGTYGYFRDTSPRIDAFAEQSIVFENAIAPMATTLPTHVSILTGTYPLEHGVLANVMHGGRRFVPAAGLRSFAMLCRKQGYHTAAFVSAAPLKRDSGIQVGFEIFDEPEESAAERSGGETTDAALRWLAGPKAGPFLLWVHYYDAHWPFAAPAPYDGRYRTDATLERYIAERRIAAASSREGVGREEARPALNAYDAELRYQDFQVGRLLDALRARHDWDRTAVVLVGDHGEGLSQHGHAAHGGTWNEQLRSPLLIRAPGHAPRRLAEPISLVDTLPTLLGLLDAPALEGLLEQASGRDVLAGGIEFEAVLSQDTARPSKAGAYRFALTSTRWKYFQIHDAEQISEELYDLEADPFELTDVSRQHPETTQRLRAELVAQLEEQTKRAEQLGGGNRPQTRATDPSILEQLRALGYLEEEETAAAPEEVSGSSAPAEP